jgi:hypothetical protein
LLNIASVISVRFKGILVLVLFKSTRAGVQVDTLKLQMLRGTNLLSGNIVILLNLRSEARL